MVDSAKTIRIDGSGRIVSDREGAAAESAVSEHEAPQEGKASSGEFDEEAVELARAAIDQCRTSLMLIYRFMDSALWRMPLVPASILQSVGTDGMTMWFSPILALRRFRQDPNELARDVLHCLLHCILREPFDKTHENTRAWWLACDMAVEAMAIGIASSAFPSEWDRTRSAMLEEFRKVCEVVTPEKLYEIIDEPIRRAAMKGEEALAPYEITEEFFLRDDHYYWPQFWEHAQNPNERRAEEMLQGEAGSEGFKSDEGEESDENPGDRDHESTGNDMPDDEAHSPENHDEESDHDATQQLQAEIGDTDEEGDTDYESAPFELISEDPDDPDREEAEQDWAEISLQIQQDLETYSQASSDTCMLTNIRLANRRPVDYSSFLRRFAALREDLKINDDEFDYIFYTYGLEHYDEMPLIEPLEYQELNRIREFVIAIDTSGSCSGELVRHFLDRTFQILRESEEFGGKVNIHIVQCDTEIREDTKISDMEELKRFGDNFQVKGMGGTDFRPVFDFVDDLIEEGEFDDLRGVIYFTDGYGTFPKNAPKYDTAFVFVEDQGQSRNVPPWAMKVVLRNEQLKVL